MNNVLKAYLTILANKHILGEEEITKMLHKVANLDKYCKSAGCYEARKPAPINPKFPQSKYCVHHAKIAKQNAEFFGRKLPKIG